MHTVCVKAAAASEKSKFSSYVAPERDMSTRHVHVKIKHAPNSSEGMRQQHKVLHRTLLAMIKTHLTTDFRRAHGEACHRADPQVQRRWQTRHMATATRGGDAVRSPAARQYPPLMGHIQYHV